MSRILVDAEKGVVALFHDIEQPPTNGASLPDEALRIAGGLALRLGLDVAELTPLHMGWLFDIANHVIDTLTAHHDATQPVAGTEPVTETEVGPAPGETPAGAVNHEVQAPPAPGAEGPTPATSPALGGGAPPAAPADTDASDVHSARIEDAIAKAQAEFGHASGAGA